MVAVEVVCLKHPRSPFLPFPQARRRAGVVAAGLLVCAVAHAERARPDHIADRSLRFDQTVHVMAHNAFNHSGWSNQTLSVREQLARGVRAFQLDVHYSGGQLKVCHGVCNALVGRVAPLRDDLRTIARFLAASPSEIVTVHLEVPLDGGVTRERLRAFIEREPGLLPHTFNPEHTRWAGHGEWPTLDEMVQANQRLLLMSDRSGLRGSYADGQVHLLYDQDVLVQNYWSLGGSVFEHDNSCRTRWEALPLDTARGLRGWRRLFLMNHFHSVPLDHHSDLDNRWDRLTARVLDHCGPVAGREPNFISVDHVDRGDVLAYVEYRNNGGIVAYEAAGAGGDVVCGFSSVIARGWRLQDRERLGCENDEMVSLVLQGMKAGQRVSFHDRPDGHRDDDFGVLHIDRDIPWDQPQLVYRLDQSQQSPYFRYNYSGGNGLAGKVSHVRVEPVPVPWSDVALTLHRDDGGRGRISCGFGMEHSRFWNLQQEPGCHNDDARSLRVLAARAGTVITVYDSPSGSTRDDYTTIWIHRDLLTPQVVNRLDVSAHLGWATVRHHRVNGLQGKVSAVRVAAP